jgi:hypothetical protein
MGTIRLQTTLAQSRKEQCSTLNETPSMQCINVRVSGIRDAETSCCAGAGTVLNVVRT